MLYPGTFGSLFFEETNVSKFLEKFENMWDNYQMSISKKIHRLPWYCEMFIAKYVKLIISFLGLN